MGWRLLDRKGRGESIPALFGLGLATMALTAVAEVIWPALVFEMDALFLLKANFSLILGLSPDWVMFAVPISIALGAAWSRRLAPASVSPSVGAAPAPEVAGRCPFPASRSPSRSATGRSAWTTTSGWSCRTRHLEATT